MRVATHTRRTGADLLTALQFLTRIPVPSQPYEASSLARSVKFFPLVGLIVGCCAATLHLLLAPHLPRPVVAFFVLAFLILITGGLPQSAAGARACLRKPLRPEELLAEIDSAFAAP